MTKRRPYQLGKRAASVAATKTRILEAATAEFAINGIENTSMQAVARRADVAAGTVLYHYPKPDDLVAAAVEQWIAAIDPPAASAIDPASPLDSRVHELVTAMYNFYERSGWAHQIYLKSPDNPVLAAARNDWDRSFEELLAAALADPAPQPGTLRLVSIFLDPAFRSLLLSRGFDQDQAVESATTLILNTSPETQD